MGPAASVEGDRFQDIDVNIYLSERRTKKPCKMCSYGQSTVEKSKHTLMGNMVLLTFLSGGSSKDRVRKLATPQAVGWRPALLKGTVASWCCAGELNAGLAVPCHRLCRAGSPRSSVGPHKAGQVAATSVKTAGSPGMIAALDDREHPAACLHRGGAGAQ